MPYREITIYEDRYEELLESQRILQKLYEHGVDNWEGYDEAMREIREENDVYL